MSMLNYTEIVENAVLCSDYPYFFEDGTKLKVPSEIKPPLKTRPQKTKSDA